MGRESTFMIVVKIQSGGEGHNGGFLNWETGPDRLRDASRGWVEEV